MPCFESPSRAKIVQQALECRAHEFRVPDVDSRPFLARVHAERYLNFLESAWDQWLALSPDNTQEQPFPSVWPIRT